VTLKNMLFCVTLIIANNCTERSPSGEATAQRVNKMFRDFVSPKFHYSVQQKPETAIHLEPDECIPDTHAPCFLLCLLCLSGARGSVVGLGTMLQAGMSQHRIPMRSLDFPIDPILSAALWPWG
jgi:hypothetical protein